MKYGLVVSILLVIFASFISLSPGLLFSKPVTESTVEAVAATHLAIQDEVERKILEKKGIKEYREHTISGTRELKDSETGEVLAYVLALEPKGFIVISSDTDIPPVIAHSFNCDFPLEAPEPNPLLDLVWWDMENRLDALPLISDGLKEENNRLWESYLLAEASFLGKLACTTIYGPYLNTEWNQNSPYNDYCPYDTVQATRCVVGCVATAMAQVINYHRYPSSVIFTSADNYTSPGGYGTPSIAITASTASISSIPYSDTNTDTAARLSYACGVSVEMRYTWYSSNAQESDAADAFKQKFSYQSANYHTTYEAGFYTTLQNNIINTLPALLGIAKTGIGANHEIVCDGYNSSTTMYHLNFGWGYDNAWYLLPSGLPEGYDAVTSGVFDIQPGSGPATTPTPAPTPIPPPASDYRVLGGGDYNGDGKSDIAIFRPTSGLWSVRGLTRVYFGGSSDIPIPGDYDGNGTTRIGIFRPSSGLWAIQGYKRYYHGSSTDIPVPGDYTGTGRCNIGIFRPSSGLWSVMGITRYYFGSSSDRPAPADYSGDNTTEACIFRESSGLWAMRDGDRTYFGASGDIPVPMDLDGDGDCGAGIFRPSSGLWSVKAATRCYFGASSDQPVPADYDGLGGDDIGIFRASTGLWSIRGQSRYYFGASGDIPVTR